MKTRIRVLLLGALVAMLQAGCSLYNTDVSLEGITWYIHHPSLDCLFCPFANPDCPYYNYDECEWAYVPAQPLISAVNAPAVVKKADEE